MLTKEISHPPIVQHVLETGYGLDLNDVELEEIGKDPFLIACAYNKSDRCVVTSEVSRPKKKRQNRKIPDVCDSLSVRWISGFALLDELDFRTNWSP